MWQERAAGCFGWSWLLWMELYGLSCRLDAPGRATADFSRERTQKIITKPHFKCGSGVEILDL